MGQRQMIRSMAKPARNRAHFRRICPVMVRKCSKLKLPNGLVLHARHILAHCAPGERPQDVFRLVFCSSSIVGVNIADISQFTNLKYLDLSDNSVPMHALSVLPALIELYLHCNRIRVIEIQNGDELPHQLFN